MDNFRYIRSFKVTAVVQRDTIFMHDKTKVLCSKLPQWPTLKKQKNTLCLLHGSLLWAHVELLLSLLLLFLFFGFVWFTQFCSNLVEKE